MSVSVSRHNAPSCTAFINYSASATLLRSKPAESSGNDHNLLVTGTRTKADKFQ